MTTEEREQQIAKIVQALEKRAAEGGWTYDWWSVGDTQPLAPEEIYAEGLRAGWAEGLRESTDGRPQASQWHAWWEGVQAAVNRWHLGRDYIMANPYPRPEGLDELIPGPLPDRDDGYVTRDPEPWERFDGTRAPHTGGNLGGSGYKFAPRPEYEK
jgi:hypothetical protein